MKTHKIYSNLFNQPFTYQFVKNNQTSQEMKPNVIGGGPGSHNQVYDRHLSSSSFGNSAFALSQGIEGQRQCTYKEYLRDCFVYKDFQDL